MARQIKSTKSIIGSLVSLVVVICLVLTASSLGLAPEGTPSWQTLFGQKAEQLDTSTINTTDKSEVHFIDCGQGDCAMIKSNGVVTVIDAGPGANSEKVFEYIEKSGVTKIDNLVLTHMHEDHIGGAKKLIERFDIGKIYACMPKEGTEPSTTVYYNLLKAISKKGLSINSTKAGDKFMAGAFTMDVLSPSKDYDKTNNQSLVIHATYNKISFLFTGDAETDPCNDMLKSYKFELKSTVLKVGHHGSKTSTSKKFLSAVSPTYAVISCGEGNDYNHPHGTILKRLNEQDVKIYRTDLQGSIVMLTNGESININIEKAAG